MATPGDRELAAQVRTAPPKYDIVNQPPPMAAKNTAPDPRAMGQQDDLSGSNSVNLQQQNNMTVRTSPFGPSKNEYEALPEGYSFAPYGGQEGEEAFYNAMERGPRAIQQNLNEAGQLQAQQGKELADAYAAERDRSVKAAAIAASKRMEQQAEYQRRVQQLDQETQKYSNDLNDQGKFWQNPGNIIAAISFSLMPIVSNDPSVGVKLINQAVQQDLAHRKEAAAMNLGALRSNLHGYRQLMEDDQAGDLMAESEAHRVAALEIQRIGAKFGGAESQKKMAAFAQAEMDKSNMLRNEAWKRDLYRPNRVVNKALAAGIYRGPGGEQALGDPWAGPPQEYNPGRMEVSPNMRAQMAQQRAQIPARMGGSPVPGSPSNASGASPSPAQAKGPKYHGLDPNAEASVEAARNWTAQDIRMRFPNATNEKLNEEWDKTVKHAESQIQASQGDLSKLAEIRKQASDIKNRILQIQRDAEAAGEDPEDYVSLQRKILPNAVMQRYDDVTASSPDKAGSDAARRAARRVQEVRQFRQLTQSLINSFYHEKFGGAQNAGRSMFDDSEVGRGRSEVRADMPLADLLAFASRADQLSSDKAEELMRNWHPMAKAMYRTNSMQHMIPMTRGGAVSGENAR